MKNIFLTSILMIVIQSISYNQGYQIGDIADDFSLINVNDKKVSMADFKDANGYIIVFTCNHCPYAKMYEKRIIHLQKKYSKKGYPVIAINPNDPEVVPEDSFENMKQIAKKKKYPFPYLTDANQTVYPKFGATKTPHVFLLDKNKVVKYIGAIDDNPKDENNVKLHYVEDAIRAIEAGNNPDPAITKAIGCSVKKKS